MNARDKHAAAVQKLTGGLKGGAPPSDTELLDWMERFWRERACPPVYYEDDEPGCFIPRAGGVWPSGMDLRAALRVMRSKTNA